MNTKSGYPFKTGRFGVGRVLYGAKFKHEFSHPPEDRPPWDFGPKAFWFSTAFIVMPSRAFESLPGKPGFPKAVCTGSNKRSYAEIATQNPGFGRPMRPAMAHSL